MDDGKSDVLQQFCDITGVDDVAAAMNVLEATNWALEDAVNLQFATGGDLAGGGGNAAAGGGAAQLPALDEEEVRAPLPVVRDRLYGDVGMHGVPSRGVARYDAPPPDRGPTHIDVFQNFEPPKAAGEGADAAGSAAAAAAAGGAQALPPSSGGNALSNLFKPPAGLLFEGSFEAAKTHATDKGCWLLVNVQNADEFATHRLNRDTWGNELVQDMVRESFVVLQVYNTSPQGGALVMQYHLDELPAIFIVDPITGAKLWQRAGFVSPDALIEELVPFLDVGPNHPDASKLAHRFHAQAAKRRHKSSGPGPAAFNDNMTEEDQLAMALAMSVEGQGAGGSGRQPSLDDLDEAAIMQEIQKRQKQEAAAAAAAGHATSHAPTPQPAAAAAAAEPAASDVGALQEAAAARLPPEPASGSAGSCRIAFRLPDGSRVQRTFNNSDTVAALQDFVVSVSKEAAQMPGFVLAEPRPGSAALTDLAATIEAAGVANAMLVLRSS